MSKRLIASIKSSIVRLDKKIITGTEEISGWKLQREKFLEALKLVEPKQEAAPAPKEGDTGVTTVEEIFEGHTGQKLPAFIGKKTATA